MIGKSNRKGKEPKSPWNPVPAVEGGAMVEDAGAGEAKLLYLFCRIMGGPIVHTLYVVDIPHPLPPDSPADSSIIPELKPLSPRIEFPREEYPAKMCCVVLDSEFYFFGGEFNQGIDLSYARDVYIFNPKAQIVSDSDKNNLPLKRGPQMKTGKINPVGFVVDQKIHALSGVRRTYKGKDLTPFERFDPRNVGDDGSGKWIELKGPPFGCNIIAHTIINRKVFVLNQNFVLYYYHIDLNEWFRVGQHSPKFERRADFVEDTLYCLSFGDTVLSYGPLRSEGSSSEEELFAFRNKAPLMPQVIVRQIPGHFSSSSLRHIGNRRFCCVLAGSPADPEDPETEHRELRYISLTIFEALKDTYAVGERTYLKGKFLHSSRFVIKISDAFSGHFVLIDCFALPK